MPPWCKIQVYLLCRGKTCMKQVHISKRLKYIKWTTHWAQKILNFNLAENFSTMHGCHSFYNSQWYSLWQELSMGTNMLTLWLPSPWSLTYFFKNFNNTNNCWRVRVRVLIFHTSYTCDKIVGRNICDPWP